ncbi:hypothetical protein [Desulfotalea psychrophila]|nr:hypothetical protein [Desulfotalea psychrophila]
MRTLFWTFKGGQGKTTLAVSYALYSDSYFITNDTESGTLDIYGGLFSSDKMESLGRGEDLVLRERNEVYDLGGWSDSLAEKVASNCEICVIPVSFNSISEITPSIKAINSLSIYNKSIVLVINNTDKKEAVEAKKYFEKEYPKIKVFIVNKSKYIHRLANENKTVFEIAEQNGLTRYNTKQLRNQLTTLFDYIKNYDN